MTISAAPTVPNPNSASFAADAYPFTQWMAALGPEIDAETARINAIGFGAYSATSTTSLAVGTGSKSLTIDTGKSFAVGQPVIIASTANPADYMTGQVTSYDAVTGALVVNATSTAGSGTVADWTISITALVAGGGDTLDSLVVLTSATSWTCPAGVTKAVITVVGAGGGGGSSAGTGGAGGGGAGGFARVVAAVVPATAYTYAIGAAGAAGAGAGSGGTGGNSTITIGATTYTGNGGGGGGGSASGACGGGGDGGTGSNGTLNGNGGSGTPGAAGPTGGKGGVSIGGTKGGDAQAAGTAGRIILELYK